MNELQSVIIVSCPSCYGVDGWPIHLLTLEYGICLCISTYRLIQEFKIQNLKKNWWKCLCLVGMTIFLFLQSLFKVVPFPHIYFTDIFLCDQLPRYFLFLSFLFLALWLGNVIFKGYGKDICCGIVIPILLLGLSGLALVGLFIFSFFIANKYVDQDEISNYDNATSVAVCINTGVVCISLIIYTSRFGFVFMKTPVLRFVKRQLSFLLLVLITSLILFFARFVWSLSVLFKKNILNEKFMNYASECHQNDECISLYIFTTVYLTFMDILPTFLLLLVFSIRTSSPLSHSQPNVYFSKEKSSTPRIPTVYNSFSYENNNSNNNNGILSLPYYHTNSNSERFGIDPSYIPPIDNVESGNKKKIRFGEFEEEVSPSFLASSMPSATSPDDSSIHPLLSFSETRIQYSSITGISPIILSQSLGLESNCSSVYDKNDDDDDIVNDF